VQIKSKCISSQSHLWHISIWITRLPNRYRIFSVGKHSSSIIFQFLFSSKWSAITAFRYLRVLDLRNRIIDKCLVSQESRLLFSLHLKENSDFSSAETIASSLRDIRYAVPWLLRLTIELRNVFSPSWWQSFCCQEKIEAKLSNRRIFNVALSSGSIEPHSWSLLYFLQSLLILLFTSAIVRLLVQN
jgi:hypothetical protein